MRRGGGTPLMATTVTQMRQCRMLFALPRGRIACCIFMTLSALACGSSGTDRPTTPSAPSPAPAPGEPVVDIAGNWVGTMESANFGVQTMSMVVVQLSNCVDGSWKSADGEWSGAISGLAGKDSFSGDISFERRSGGGCLATGSVTGGVGSGTLQWTSSGATPLGPCTGDLPRSIVIAMRRQ
jgi:hypothetical protein